MLPQSKTFINLVNRRCLFTSPKVCFKFKLTEESSRAYEEKKKKELEAQEQPKFAPFTLESPLIMGRVSHDRYNKVVKVAVPKHRLNEYLTMYIRDLDHIQAHDEDGISSPGDWILLKRLEKPIDKGVEHKVFKIVHKYGRYIDPITGRRSLGIYFDDEFERLEKIKLDVQQ